MNNMGMVVAETAKAELCSFALDDQCGHLIRRAHQRASSIFLSVLRSADLTPTQFFALARLYERGQVSQNRLGRLAAMDPATIQGVIRRLADRGLIERDADQSDRRRMVLRLSPRGLDLVEKLTEDMQRADAAILAPLSQEERASFLYLLRRLT